MPTFDTPEPITAVVELPVGDVRVTASDRNDTVVEVRPSDDVHEPDVRAAQHTRVEYAAGRLLVTAPKQRALGLFGKPGSIEVTIDLPAGSHVQGRTSVATLRSAGRLGECEFKSSAGDIQVDQAGNLDLHTGGGAIVVNHATGNAELITGTGRIRVREVDGPAVIKNSNGDTWVGKITGELRVKAANGDIVVDKAHAGVTATTANGDIRIGEVVRGSVGLKTACGEVELGIHPGTAARLDVHTQFGRVHNHMDATAEPPASDDTVDAHARTAFGDIVIRRS